MFVTCVNTELWHKQNVKTWDLTETVLSTRIIKVLLYTKIWFNTNIPKCCTKLKLKLFNSNFVFPVTHCRIEFRRTENMKFMAEFCALGINCVGTQTIVNILCLLRIDCNTDDDVHCTNSLKFPQLYVSLHLSLWINKWRVIRIWKKTSTNLHIIISIISRVILCICALDVFDITG